MDAIYEGCPAYRSSHSTRVLVPVMQCSSATIRGVVMWWGLRREVKGTTPAPGTVPVLHLWGIHEPLPSFLARGYDINLYCAMRPIK